MSSIIETLDAEAYFKAYGSEQETSVELPNEEKPDVERIRREISEGTPDVLNFSDLEPEGISLKSEARKGMSIGESKYSLMPRDWQPSAPEAAHGRVRKLNSIPENIIEVRKIRLTDYDFYYIFNKRTGKAMNTPGSTMLAKRSVE